MKSPKLPAVYMDSCCFIDMVTFSHSKGMELDSERQQLIWYYKRILKASRDEKIWVYAAGLAKDECVTIRSKDGLTRFFDDEVKRLYRSIFDSDRSGVTLVFEDPFISDRCRELQWSNDIRIKPPDRVHLATALERNCEEFITYDRKDFIDNKDKIERLGIVVIKANQTKILPPDYLGNEIEDAIGAK